MSRYRHLLDATFSLPLPRESAADAVASMTQLYRGWVPSDRILTMNAWSSELSKIASNAFIAQRISSINSLSAICEATAAVVDDVSRAVGSDPRIGSEMLKASLGFGGSCLRKDVMCLVYLAKSLGLDVVADYWRAVVHMNDYQNSRVSRMVIDHLGGDLPDKKIAILRFSFKKNTADTRNSSAIKLTLDFLESGASVRIYDPIISRNQILKDLASSANRTTPLNGIEQCIISDDPEETCRGVNAIFIHTDWNVFSIEGPIDWKNIERAMASPKLLIYRHSSPESYRMEKPGFIVLKIGRRSCRSSLQAGDSLPSRL